MYRPVAPVYTRFLDRSISASQSVSRNSDGHMESVQQIKRRMHFSITRYLKVNKSDAIITVKKGE